jgi:hypothetical protein
MNMNLNIHFSKGLLLQNTVRGVLTLSFFLGIAVLESLTFSGVAFAEGPFETHRIGRQEPENPCPYKPVPVPALGIGLAGLGMGLRRKYKTTCHEVQS